MVAILILNSHANPTMPHSGVGGSNITECDLNMVVEKTQYRFGFFLP